MLATSYAELERQIRSEMTLLFSDAEFDPGTDIAGIIVNRWGHARVMRPPGFYYGRDGKRPAREIVQQGFGRIAIAHAEQNGHQNATGALMQGKRLLNKWSAFRHRAGQVTGCYRRCGWTATAFRGASRSLNRPVP